MRLQYLTSSEMKTIQGHAQPRSQDVGTCNDMQQPYKVQSAVLKFKVEKNEGL